jgi:hypothetical protein
LIISLIGREGRWAVIEELSYFNGNIFCSTEGEKGKKNNNTEGIIQCRMKGAAGWD